jgi:hypothetical protein
MSSRCESIRLFLREFASRQLPDVRKVALAFEPAGANEISPSDD